MSDLRDPGLGPIFQELNKHFLEYLSSHGITPNEAGFISCLHPDHADRHPSMHIGGKEGYKDQVGYCFSCMTSCNIIHAAHYLDKKPMGGVGFYQETLPFLCKKFNITYEPVEISDDQKREYQKRRAYQDAVNIVHRMAFSKGELKMSHPAIKHLTDRGIDAAMIRKFKIGCVDSFKDYMDAMKSMGWEDRSYLEGADLANKKLFSPTGIIIPIFDDKNRPVGFVTRKTNMSPNDKGEEKYCNSLNSDIYQKSKLLYNFNDYKKEDGQLFIVEGYLDAVYMTQAGIKNVAAIGATMLTDEHVEMLWNYKVRNIVLCLDSDQGGNIGTRRAIERLSSYKTFNVRVMELPADYDPDTYIREFGKDKYLELSKPNAAMSPFAWMIKYTTFEDDPMETAKQAIPTIAAEESNITRLQMIRELSRLTGLEENDIRKDVDSLVNKESSKFLEEMGEINNFVQVQLNRRKTRDTKSILEDALIKVKGLERMYNNTLDNRNEFLTKLTHIRGKLESGDFKYGMKAMGFERFYKNFDGIPYTTCLSLVGGRPSAGKTTWMTALAMDIIDTEDDAAIFYMSIDDTTELMTLKMVAVKSGLSTSQIKRYSELGKEDKEKVDAAWAWVEDNTSRFIIADATAGNTLDALEAHVDWFMKNHKTPKKLFLLDNFHKLRAQSAGRIKKNEIISDQSERIKELTQLNDLHLMMTVELRKLEGSQSRPQLADLKDSVQMEYDADIITLIHNDYQVRETSQLVWMGDAGGNLRTMPYLGVRVWKNKITGQTGPFAYKLNNHNLRIEEVPVAEVRALTMNKDNGSSTVGSVTRQPMSTI